jgi:hypothetical protein
VEQFIAICAASQDPQKIIEVVDKIGHIDVPLEELEEYIKMDIMQRSEYLIP